MQPEQIIQRAVMLHFEMRGTEGVFPWHTPNGGKRHPAEARMFKSLGVVPGIPDILALHNGTLFGLELKTANGRETEAQVKTRLAMQRAGAEMGIAYGLEPALWQLEKWGLLKGSVA